jgi:hypothetical protein
MSGITITGSVTINQGVSLSNVRASPATAGISYASIVAIDGSAVWPAVTVINSSAWQVNITAAYGVPAGVLFASSYSNWSGGVQVITFSTGYAAGGVGRPQIYSTSAVYAGGGFFALNQAVLGVYNQSVWAPSQFVMTSLTMNTWSGTPGTSAVGACSSTGTYNNTTLSHIGDDAYSIGIYDTGIVKLNGSTVFTGPTFQTNGDVIDMLFDNVNSKLWYSVNGSAWYGS